MKADINAYLQSWTDELHASSNRVRQLIGSAHWLSDGHHKEEIIREFLTRYLPKQFAISRGFIRPPLSQDRCSPEIDILITDPLKNPAFFNGGGLRIVPPSSVVASFEVKSSFSKPNLDEALLNVLETKLSIKSWDSFEKIWTCICFFHVEESRTPESFLKTLEEALLALHKIWTAREDTATFTQMLPSCVATLTHYLVFFSPSEGNQLNLRLFDLKKISLPCAFLDLFSAIRCYAGGAIVSEFDVVIESISPGKPVSLTITF